MGNAVIAAQLLIQLLQEAQVIGQMIKDAQTSGTDITEDQLNSVVASYEKAHSKLDTDIAAAKAAGN